MSKTNFVKINGQKAYKKWWRELGGHTFPCVGGNV
jgi:hypothetical protein